MNRIQRDTLLGIVFFGTMGSLLWATVNLTDMSMGKVPPLKVWVADAGGIRIGDPVQVLGKKIGKVSAIDLDWQRPKNRVALTLRIEEAIQLRADNKIEIQAAGVLGGKQIYIDPGLGDSLPDGRELLGATASDPLKAAGDAFSGEGPVGGELKGLLVEARTFLHSLNDPDGSVGALVKRRELYDEVFSLAQSLRMSAQAIERGEGFLGRIIKDTNLRDDFLHIVQNLALVSDRLNSTDSTIGRLLNDREMSQQLGGIVLDISSIVTRIKDGRGVAGRLLTDEDMAQKVGEAITALQSVLKKADNPEAGPLGALLADLELRTNLKQIASNLASVSEKLDTGKGVLGLLIGDEEMGVRLRRILTQVSRALEDAREAAPIGNFVQVLFGVF